MCPPGTLFVYTVAASWRAAGTRYPSSVDTPPSTRSRTVGLPAAYAPPSKSACDSWATIRPSASAPVRRRIREARDRANGTSRRLREVIEDELVGREALAAEVSADGPVVHDDAILRETERRGHLVAQVERSLVRGDDAHPIGFEPHHRGPRLERCLMNARRGELVLEDARGARERSVDVAVRLDDVALLVRMRRRGPLAATLEEPVRRGVGVQDGRIGTERVVHVDQRGQLLVFDRDQANGLFGDLSRLGR